MVDLNKKTEETKPVQVVVNKPNCWWVFGHEWTSWSNVERDYSMGGLFSDSTNFVQYKSCTKCNILKSRRFN